MDLTIKYTPADYQTNAETRSSNSQHDRHTILLTIAAVEVLTTSTWF